MSPGVHKFLFLVLFLFLSFSIKSEPISGQTVVLQILDKITTKVRTFEVDVNDNVLFESLNIEIYACHTNPPEETPEDFVLLKIFDNINIDMMYNIPGQSLSRWVNDLKTLMKLDCDHIAIFPLTSETGTPFYNQVNSGEIKLPGSHIEESMFTHSSQLLSKNGFIQYEVAHFSKPGKECQHNQHYWSLDSYLAFGPSANGYDGIKRWWNVSSLDDYISKLSRNEKPVAGFETLSYTDRFNEAVMYGLRTNKGISIETLQKFKSKVYLESSLDKWKSHLDVSKETIRIRPGHYHLVDEICTNMLQ